MMVLQDHFRPPLNIRRHWHSFHNAWATYISSDLNRRLPEGYFAEANVQFGIEIDVATFEDVEIDRRNTGAVWNAPAPTRTLPFELIADVAEILVFGSESGPTLAGAIELVSPANKDRPTQRDAFVFKCASYLQKGIGLVIIDVVTDRRANLHKDLLAHLLPTEVAVPIAELYAVSYRPVTRAGQPSLDVWEEPLSVGSSLPTMPLWLPGDLCVPVDLDNSYDRTCREQRLMAAGS